MNIESELNEMDVIVKQMSVDLQKLNKELENLLNKYPRYMEISLAKLEKELQNYQNAM